MTILTISINLDTLSDREVAKILQRYSNHVDNLGVRLIVEDFPSIRDSQDRTVGFITLED